MTLAEEYPHGIPRLWLSRLDSDGKSGSIGLGGRKRVKFVEKMDRMDGLFCRFMNFYIAGFEVLVVVKLRAV